MSIGTRLRIWLLRRRIRRAKAAAEYSRQALGDAHGALLHHRRVEIEARDELQRLVFGSKVPTPRPWPPARSESHE